MFYILSGWAAEQNNQARTCVCVLLLPVTSKNAYTIALLLEHGLTRKKAEKLATKLWFHAVHKLCQIACTRYAHQLNGESEIRAAAGGTETGIGARTVWATRHMTDNPPEPHRS